MQAALLMALALIPITQNPGPSSQTPRERYLSLLKQFDAPLGTYINDQPRAKVASEPFLSLAREYPGDPASRDALNWVVTHTLFTPMAGEAMDLLARDHARAEEISGIIEELDRLYGDGFEPLERLFRHVREENPHESAQAWATLALGRLLATRCEMEERRRVEYAEFQRTGQGPIFYGPTEPKLDLNALRAEAAILFEDVIANHAKIDDLAAMAERDLFQLRELSIGRHAPEIEGVDLEGKRFKLSDYRGKVVFLEFWNDACGPCRGSYPELRALATRMEGKPFALLGVNGGDSTDVMKRITSQGDVTWRFWIDAEGADGPIHQQWNVQGWPTTYVIDASGVIRYKNPLLPSLDHFVNELIEEATRVQAAEKP